MKMGTDELVLHGTATPPELPAGSHVMTATIALPPGDPGSPPHRRSGPVFGSMLEGEMLFELEGEAPEPAERRDRRWR
jgi:quercetin dioxygenase-like cupin family protein